MWNTHTMDELSINERQKYWVPKNSLLIKKRNDVKMIYQKFIFTSQKKTKKKFPWIILQLAQRITFSLNQQRMKSILKVNFYNETARKIHCQKKKLYFIEIKCFYDDDCLHSMWWCQKKESVVKENILFVRNHHHQPKNKIK